ncbi:hypothetical protein FQA39_LY18037 [Lamprigera yunnana]|nr:hypothetical protein FQA39_LY18037 [Lamprigera yunnana]
MSVDAERAEHLAGLLTQIDVIVRASSLASISAERFGAVQHEARLAEAVNLMINHVTLLKQQRDSTRNICNIQSKKVLQDTNTTDLINTKKNLISERFLAQRRASIATITQSPELTKPVATNSSEVKRLTRRTSDISSRVSAFIRSNRPSRLELGVDLDKIKEGIVDENSVSDSSECSENCLHESIIESTETLPNQQNSTILSLKKRVSCTLEEYQRRFRIYGTNGTFHEFFYTASLLCFLLSVILLEVREDSPRHIERIYCGHLFHNECLLKYLKTPPFGNKKCTICDQKIYHQKWTVSANLAETRWAHEQARERELAEVEDFFK